ncbi:MAG: hypothetical protein ACP5Q1_01115 [Anaerolineae bacterium]
MRRYPFHFPVSIGKAALFLMLAISLIGCSEDTVNRPGPTIIPVAPSRALATATKPSPPTATAMPPAPTKAMVLPATPTPVQNEQGLARLTILYTNDTRGYVDPCG